ncbi:MAG TPA: type III pantothenate kinase [Armatimonadaceae bacterium]|nr:type III pantothenate kinase [Armatimonadaceae bacterium]
MLLAIDIGNTNTTLGLFEGDTLVADFRMRSVRDRTADEYAALLASLLLTRGASLKSVTGVAMAYVVPPVGDALRDLAHRHLGVDPLVVTSETPTGLEIRYVPPTAVGADRVVNALAAWELFARPSSESARPACVVVDYGTATTLDAVSPNAEYLGGAILPGIGVSMDALFSHAALLSRVELSEPAAAIGQNTADALRSGILYGFAAQTDGMVRRFAAELSAGGAEVRVIATGGIAPLIAPYTETIEVVDVNLTLTGLRLLWERNRQS